MMVRRITALLATAVPLSGCVVDGTGTFQGDDDVVTRTQAAALYGSFKYWDSPGTVDICFIGPGSSTPPQADQDQFEANVRAAWGGSTGLSFNFRGGCYFEISDWYKLYVADEDWITVYLDMGGGKGGQAVAGKGARLSQNEPNASRWEFRKDIQISCPTSTRWTHQHEFGHALGLAHEHARTDREVDCSKKTSSSLRLRTDYDRDSIMNYAECGGVPDFAGTSTALDRVTVETLYPKGASVALGCVSGPCFNTASGVVTMEQGAYSSDWIARGAWMDVSYFFSTYSFRGDEKKYLLGSQYDGNIEFWMKSPNGSYYPAEGKVIHNKSKYTALVMAVL